LLGLLAIGAAAASATPGYWQLFVTQSPFPYTEASVGRQGAFGELVHLRITRKGQLIAEQTGFYAASLEQVPQTGDLVTAESSSGIKESVTYDGLPTVAGPLCAGSVTISGAKSPGATISIYRYNTSEYGSYAPAKVSYPSESSFLGTFEVPAVVGEQVGVAQIINQTLPEEVISTYQVARTDVVEACGGGGGGSGSGQTGSRPAGTSGGGGSATSQVEAFKSSAPAAPVLGKTANVTAVSGQVKVRLPGTTSFVPLTSLQQIPFGSTIDATNGAVSVTTAGPHGGTQTAQFRGGQFVLTQASNGLVLATLTGGDFSVCVNARKASVQAGRAARRSALGKHVVRKLWTNAHGKFGTKGRYVVATVEGTEWLTEDLCEGSLVRVTRDRVAVTDLPHHRHLVLRAGRTYVAKRH
jgi:hypothetical protein